MREINNIKLEKYDIYRNDASIMGQLYKENDASDRVYLSYVRSIKCSISIKTGDIPIYLFIKTLKT